jgi:4-amino-4-deoxy-L-arabinose transferase-like glycosyltransferase
MIRLSKDKLFWVILFLLVAIRFINISMPILEGTATRQVQTAMIARNLYTGGFNILYPQVDFLGPGPGYMILEFPLYNFMVAILYFMLGGVYEWAGRFLTVLFYAGASVFLYKIVHGLFDKKTALISVIVFGLSPISIIYSRAIMPDFPTLFFVIGSLYFMLKYAEKEHATNFWISCVFTMLALLVKPQSFYVAIPLAYLLWHKDRWNFFIKPRNWLYLIIVVLPVVAWLLHGRSVHSLVSIREAYNFELNNWFEPALMLSVDYYSNTWRIIIDWVLSPLGFSLFFIGIFIRPYKNSQRLIWYWLFGVVVYYIVFNTHIMGQEYYHIALVPIASIFIALAGISIFNKDFIQKTLFSNRLVLIVTALLVSLPILRYAAYAFVVPRGYQHIPALSRQLEGMTDKDMLLIVSIPSGHSPLYYSKRKGWSFGLPGNDLRKTKRAIKYLEDLKEQGAKYFVSTCDSFLDKSPDFKKYLNKKYKIVDEKSGVYSVYSLK